MTKPERVYIDISEEPKWWYREPFWLGDGTPAEEYIHIDADRTQRNALADELEAAMRFPKLADNVAVYRVLAYLRGDA